jgi:NAD(P)-dependent dehydrogenase (short-subunit alcohol dehydrogenase family)
VSARWVLVTGAARGFGRLTVETLVRHGFQVFAGIRKVADAGALTAAFGDRVHPLLLEVTDGRQLCEAVGVVEERTGDAGLAGLVNNAAAAPFGPLELAAPSELAQVLAVNVVAVHALTVAFLPALRRAAGRIVNVSSVNGRIAIPNGGLYCASKFALEGMSDSLRMELQPWGVHVVVIQPGAFDTTLRAEGIAAMLSDLERRPPEQRARYEPGLRKLAAFIAGLDAQAPHAQPVADAILAALTDPVPATRYAVGPDAAQILGAAQMPDRERDAMLLGMFGG